MILYHQKLITIILLFFALGCESETQNKKNDGTPNNENRDFQKEKKIEAPENHWANPALIYGSSLGTLIKAYYNIGDFNNLRKFIIYPECYEAVEIDNLLRTSDWGYEIKLTNLQWEPDSTSFIMTYKTTMNQTTGMEQYKGMIINDTAKLFFYPNNESHFAYNGTHEFESLCKLKKSLSSILFEFNSAKFKPQSKKHLKSILSIAKSLTGQHIKIIGHTSNEGSSEYNINLSQQRAKAVYDFLIKNGIEQSMISFEGKGDSNPIYPNNNESNREKNRRVEIKLIPIHQ